MSSGSDSSRSGDEASDASADFVYTIDDVDSPANQTPITEFASGSLNNGKEKVLESPGRGFAWRRNNSEVDEPSSSGIAEIGEDEIQELRNDGAFDSQAPGNRHVDEDDASLSWRKRKKHFFVLSHSGKPIYSNV